MGWTTTSHKFLTLPNGQLGVYNTWDAYNTARLVAPLLAEMRDAGQLGSFQSLVQPLQWAVVDMQRAGLLLDRPAEQALRETITNDLRGIDQSLKDHARAQGFKPETKFTTSKDQLAKFLYDHCQLKVSKRTAKTRRPAVDQDALTRTLRDLRKRDEPHRQFILDLFHRSRLHTIKTRYLKLDAGTDGRVRATVKMAGTKTCRFAYEDPALQQFPAECRHIFRSSPGTVFIQSDHSQLEARLLAYRAGAKRLIETFESGQDIHALNAMDLMGYTPETWAQLPKPQVKVLRGLAKNFFYRKIYGGTIASGDKKLFCPCQRCVDKVPDTLNLSATEARLAEERWSARNPEVDTMQQADARFVQRNHYLDLILGGRRYISKPWGKDLARELANIPFQTGAARVMARAQIALHRDHHRIVLQHHDAFLTEVPESQVEVAVADIRAIMEAPVPVGAYLVRLPVDIAVGRNWGDVSDSNPQGLAPWPLTK